MRQRFFKKVGSALSANNAVTDAINPADLQQVTHLSFYVVGSAGIASGAVQAEDSHDGAYAGTWAAEGAAVTIPASTVKKIVISNDNFANARIRISTVFSGGTIDVWAMGRG